jgi:hypothetical protein
MSENAPAVSPLPPLDLAQAQAHARYLRGMNLLAVADTIDALLARTLTPEEVTMLSVHDWSHLAAARRLTDKLGQIAGDR